MLKPNFEPQLFVFNRTAPFAECGVKIAFGCLWKGAWYSNKNQQMIIKINYSNNVKSSAFVGCLIFLCDVQQMVENRLLQTQYSDNNSKLMLKKGQPVIQK